MRGVFRHIALIRELLTRYEAPGLSLRLYAYIRFSLIPYWRLASLFPERGRLLDVGCGFGLWLHYLATLKPELEMEGVDVDPRKISVARQSSTERIDFQLRNLADVDSGSYDSVCMVDVMYLVTGEDRAAITGDMFRVLKPGGVLILKDVDLKPRWKFAIAWLEEFVAVKGFGLSSSTGLAFRSAPELVRQLEAAGFVDAAITRIDKWFLHSHVVVTAVRPASEPAAGVTD